jgi:hypothetical protein
VHDWSEAVLIDPSLLLEADTASPALKRRDDAAYSQVYANSGRNSYSPVAARAEREIQAVATLDQDSHTAEGRYWSSPPRRIIVVDESELVIDNPDGKLWQVSLETGLRFSAPWYPGADRKLSSRHHFGGYILVALSESVGEYVAGDSSTVSVFEPEFSGGLAPRHTEVVTFGTTGRDMIVLRNAQHSPRDYDFAVSAALRRKRRDTLRELWSIGFIGVTSFYSPILSDHSVVVHLPKWVVVVDAEDGHIRHKTPIALLGDQLATDHFDRIWGYHVFSKRLHLLGLRTSGVPFFYSPLPEGARVDQPPICYPDGRVCVAARSFVRCYFPSGDSWDFPLSSDSRKTATATAEGDLFVAGGSEIIRIDAAGNEVWRARTPDDREITTNIAVTEDGTVCFVADYNVYCMKRDAETEAR